MKCSLNFSRKSEFLFLLIFLSITGCSAVNTTGSTEKNSTCTASECHVSTLLRQYPPNTGKHTEHLTRGYICEDCHFEYYNKPEHRNGVYNARSTNAIIYFDQQKSTASWDNSAGNCSNISCHRSATGSAGWYDSLSNECKACHQDGSSIDPIVTNRDGINGKHFIHREAAGFKCVNCHNGYKKQTTHMNGIYGRTETATIIYFGDSFKGSTVSGAFNDTSGTCNSISCHGYSNGISWYADESPVEISKIETKTNGCYACHSTGSQNDPAVIDTAAGKGRHVKHAGIYCEKCHSGYGSYSLHKNGIFDQESSSAQLITFDSSNTGGQWINDTGAQTGSCTNLTCHPSAALDWYGTTVWPIPACSDCHKAAVGSRRQVFDSNGNGTGTGGDFNKTSHHVIDYASSTRQIVQESDCTACHDQDRHMSGLIRLKDYNNPGQVVLYNPATPSSAEAFCLGCHDTDGANGNMKPFASTTNTLGTGRNIAGTKIKSAWEMQNGHRRKGLTCLGDGTPGTGCHGNYNSSTATSTINAHGSGNTGLLANKMVLPVPNATWDETRYKLCLDCHNNYSSLPTVEELVRVAPGGNYSQNQPNYTQFPYQTGFMSGGFHDYKAYNYDRQFNLHLYHLQISMWYYRGVTSSGAQSCVTCHNVHGTNGRYSYIWDEWYFTIEIEDGIEYGKFGNANFPATQYPEYCSANCHWDGTYRYARTSLNEAYTYASKATGTLVSEDVVTIIFSDPTKGLSIVSANSTTTSDFSIDQVLPLNNSHKWGTVSAVWSDSNKKLTVTINTPDASPAAVNDIITLAPYQSGVGYNKFTVYNWSILDTKGVPYRGKITIKGGN